MSESVNLLPIITLISSSTFSHEMSNEFVRMSRPVFFWSDLFSNFQAFHFNVNL